MEDWSKFHFLFFTTKTEATLDTITKTAPPPCSDIGLRAYFSSSPFEPKDIDPIVLILGLHLSATKKKKKNLGSLLNCHRN